MAAQAVVLWQILEQLPAQAHSVWSVSHTQVLQCPLDAVDLPATRLCIQKKVQQPTWLEQAR